MPPTPPLAARLRPLLLLGLPIAGLRYVAEFVAPEHAGWFGVYYAMALAIAVLGVRRSWGPIRWRALLGTMALLAVVVWFVPNLIAYTTGQFLGWNHGRFHYGGPGDPANKAAPIAATTLGKIGTGAFVALLTTVAGTVWCTLWGTLLIWLPGRLGRKG